MCCLNILISVEIYSVSVHLKIGLQENVLLDIYSKNVEGKRGILEVSGSAMTICQKDTESQGLK